MMGLMSAEGSEGRTVGPLVLANIYYEEGPRTIFSYARNNQLGSNYPVDLLQENYTIFCLLLEKSKMETIKY